MIFLERTREGHRQSHEDWNSSKADVGETSEGRSGALMGFSERVNTCLLYTSPSPRDQLSSRMPSSA